MDESGAIDRGSASDLISCTTVNPVAPALSIAQSLNTTTTWFRTQAALIKHPAAPLDPCSGPTFNRAMSISDSDWLIWARELQAIAQTGLTFSRDPYDRERYEAVRGLAARMFAAGTDAPAERIAALFVGETGYATPKIDVRAGVFDHDERILLVRESADGGRWTLPRGWADVNLTAAENAAKRPVKSPRASEPPKPAGSPPDRLAGFGRLNRPLNSHPRNENRLLWAPP